MRLKIVYDNEAESGFISGWGFSCLIETTDEKILFDTGWDGNLLLHNMKRFGVEREDINSIVISHAHWDHAGGITHVLHPEVSIYVPHSFSSRLKKEISDRAGLLETGATEITEGVYTTDEIGSKIKEQAVVLKTEGGVVVVTGCAHPGLEKMLDSARRIGEVHGVIGGFHGFNKFERLEDVSMIVPCHCTRYKSRLKKRFPDACMECKAGVVIEI